MARLDRPHGVRGPRAQAAYFHARERRRSLVDPSSELFRTALVSETGVLDSDVIVPSGAGDRDATVAVELNAAAIGSVAASLGAGVSSARGFHVLTSGLTVLVVAGAGTGDPTNSAIVSVPGALVAGRNHKIVASVRPGTATVKVWLDGELIGSATAPSGTFGSGGWRGTSDGLISDSGGTKFVAYSIFLGQVPRQF